MATPIFFRNGDPPGGPQGGRPAGYAGMGSLYLIMAANVPAKTPSSGQSPHLWQREMAASRDDAFAIGTPFSAEFFEIGKRIKLFFVFLMPLNGQVRNSPLLYHFYHTQIRF
jgi:hypothetical protein